MIEESSSALLLQHIADELQQKRSAGAVLDVSEYVQRFPHLAAEIRDIATALDYLPGRIDSSPSPQDPHANPHLSALPACIGSYRLLREIGRGGMGVVYEAHDEELKRSVALKVLTLQQAKSLRRFEQEARNAARLNHRNIVPVFDSGQHDGLPYYAMEFVDGSSLAQWLQEIRALHRAHPQRSFESLASETSQRLTQRSWKSHTHFVAEIGRELAEALTYAHAHGVLHRDIKPSNTLLRPSGQPCITDFGLSKASDAEDMTHAGDWVGTLRYLAPERLDGESDVQGDVYSLGLLLTELATGIPPFVEVEGGLPLLYALSNETPPYDSHSCLAQLPRDLTSILLKATATDRRRRYATARELSEELTAFLRGDPISAREATLRYLLQLYLRRHRGAAMSVVALFLCGIALFALHVSRLETSLLKTQALGLAASSAEAVRTDPMLALLLAQQGVELERSVETVSTLHHALASLHEIRSVERFTSIPRTVRFHPDTSGILATAAGEVLLCSEASTESTTWALESRCTGAGFLSNTQVWCADRVGDITMSSDGQTPSATFSLPPTVLQRTSSETNPVEQVLRLAGEGLRFLYVMSSGDLYQVEVDTGITQHWSPIADVQHVHSFPDGKTLLVLHRSGGGSVWTVDQQCLNRFSISRHRSPSASFTADGELFVLQQHPTPVVYDRRGVEIARLERHRDRVTAVRFSPDGAFIVTASEDQTACLWSRTGKFLREFRGHGGGISDVVFAPDSASLLTASYDQTLKHWKLDGTLLATFHGHRGAVLGLAVAADGKSVASISADRSLRIWSLSPWGVPTLRPHDEGIYSATFSSDGSAILTASKDGFATLHSLTGPHHVRFGKHPTTVFSAEFTTDGQHVFTTTPDGHGRLWNLSGKLEQDIILEAGGRFLALHRHATGDFFLTRSRESTVKVWHDDTCVAQLVGHRGRVWSAQFDHRGERILTAGADSTARLWDREGKLLAQLVGHAAAVRHAVFSTDGHTLLTASDDGAARLWNSQGHCLATLRGHKGAVLSVDMSADGSRIVTASRDKTARLWDARGNALATLSGHHGVVWSAAFNPRGTRVVTASFDGSARLWWVDTEQLLRVARNLSSRQLTLSERERYDLFLPNATPHLQPPPSG